MASGSGRQEGLNHMNKQKKFFIWNRKRAAAAIAVTAAMLMITAFTAHGGDLSGEGARAAVLLSLGAGLFVLLKLRIGRIGSALLYLLLPVAALWALENYTHVITDLAPLILVLNLLFFYLLYGLLIALCGSVRTGVLVATLVPLFAGLVNYFVVDFRGTPVVPWDLLSLGTAVSVADNYVFTLSQKACFSILVFFWIAVVASKSTVRFARRMPRLASVAVYALLLCLYVGAIQKSAVQSFFGMDTTLFTLNVLYRNNGIAAAFLGNLRFLNIEEPDGYSPKNVEALIAQVRAESEEQPETEAVSQAEQTEPETGNVSQIEQTEPETESVSQTEQTEPETGNVSQSGQPESETEIVKQTEPETETMIQLEAGTTVQAAAADYPNVVIIMDEAFSDLSVWGEFATSEEVMPFFKRLQEEAVGGEVYVSVKGGNTANTEFELLTGDTMGFLPTGSVPYQQYIHHETPSLASYLKSLGYRTTAIHPYNRSGWDRDKVYEQFGFDEFLDKNAFGDPLRLRGYISDRSAFEKIIEQFQLKGEDERAFVFEVTMQNHGGYSRETPDFDIYLTLPEVTNKTTSVVATEKYLTLMNQTDRALEELITYFEEQDEPVIVLMFGDHQPSDYITNVIRRICGVQEEDTLEFMEQGYRVPFVIWSNYGLEHRYYDGISVNYLGTLLMQNAGIPLTGYQTFLGRLMEDLPVINGLVYRDADGSFHSYDEQDGQAGELLNQYRMLQYNHLVDTKNRAEDFFD